MWPHLRRRSWHFKRRKNGFATCWNEMELGMGTIAIPLSLDLENHLKGI